MVIKIDDVEVLHLGYQTGRLLQGLVTDADGVTANALPLLLGEAAAAQGDLSLGHLCRVNGPDGGQGKVGHQLVGNGLDGCDVQGPRGTRVVHAHDLQASPNCPAVLLDQHARNLEHGRQRVRVEQRHGIHDLERLPAGSANEEACHCLGGVLAAMHHHLRVGLRVEGIGLGRGTATSCRHFREDPRWPVQGVWGPRVARRA
mmetsp:Transcript_1440/g.3253  ORF Transcript_1440/g.3253 Transcript_1440/m.3253 type:complete len:202 (+) Transcript_1440:217-822(+)